MAYLSKPISGLKGGRYDDEGLNYYADGSPGYPRYTPDYLIGAL